MKALRKLRLLTWFLCLWIAFYPLKGAADDIDIFVGSSAGSAANPNVLIVLDNTSNWARQSQQWPGGEQQGQSEVAAINSVIQSLPTNVNVGLMEFVTGGNANDDGGFIRYAIQSMTSAAKASFSTVLTTIYNNVTSPNEKRNSNTSYGDLMWDVYNYFAGANQSQAGAGTLAALADSNGYTSNYGTFKSPLNCGTSCARNFIIFISNPNASGPASDSATNTNALAALGGTTTQIGLPNFTTTTTPTTFPLYQTDYCYGSQSACNTGEGTNSSFTSQCPPTTTGNYNSCSCAAANDASYPAMSLLPACSPGQQRFTVIGTNNAQTTGPTVGTPILTTANSNACYATATAAASAIGSGSDTGGMTCPAATTVTSGNTTTRTTYSCTYSASAAAGTTTGCTAAPIVTTASSSTCYGSSATATTAVTNGTERGGLVCPTGYSCTYSMTGQAASDACTTAASSTYTLGAATNMTAETQTASTTSCYSGVSTGSNKWSSSTDHAGLSCPVASTATTVSGSTVSQKTYSGSCTYSGADGAACAARGTETIQVTQSTTPTQRTATVHNYTVQQTATPSVGSTTAHYTVTQTATPSVTVTTTGSFNTVLGTTLQCYSSLASCSTADFAGACSSYSNGCSCSSNGATSAAIACPSGLSYQVTGTSNVITNTATGTYTTDTNPFNADEWARFLFKKGIPIPRDAATGNACNNQTVTSYTIDVYNAQPNAQNTALMISMAKNGGGKYFNASNKQAIINALKQIFVEIQAVNSTFASASLPINATNRAQNANQVFIGMFRPDATARPRWFGNVKRYQLITDTNGELQLGDVNGANAINLNTGFLTACAASWWTSDSPDPPNAPGLAGSGYWSQYSISPDPAACSANSVFSDYPDGPQVEKGAVGEELRKGNNPPSTDSTPTWTVNRNVYTASDTTLLPFNAANTSLSTTTANWVLGQDTQDENSNGNLTETRSSIHGDVVHSRPLPVNYCTSANCANVVVYYGSNDGTLRAVDAANGREKWAFVAPEFNSTLDRLRTQSPLVNYPGATFPAGLTPSPTRRNYFFDGSLGIYQNADNSKVWIFPTMRRGGRMLYALDVSDSSSPSIKWKFGCPNLTDDSNCTTGQDLTGSPGAASIGQTWSIPNVGFIKGYSTATPVTVVGGGYDSCEDTDSSAPSCSGTKGNVVYVLDAASGNVVASFSTLRGVAGDVAMIDMDFDGYVDYAYVADTGGNLYRINFASYNRSTGVVSTKTSSQWTITRIAYTSGAGRKFLFSPALFGAKGIVYVALGSGDREHPLQSNYPYTTPVTNRFYVFREKLPSPSPTTSSITGGANLDDTDKMNHSTATNPAPCSSDPELATLADNTDENNGWFMDLNNGTGEQTVTSSVISGGMVTFSTNRPIPAAVGTCSTPLGEARGYWLDLFRGTAAIETQNNATCGGIASSTFVGGGLPPSPVVGTVTIGGVPQSVVIGAIQRSGEVSSPISPQKATATNLPARKRVYTVVKGDN